MTNYSKTLDGGNYTEQERHLEGLKHLHFSQAFIEVGKGGVSNPYSRHYKTRVWI